MVCCLRLVRVEVLIFILRLVLPILLQFLVTLGGQVANTIQ